MMDVVKVRNDSLLLLQILHVGDDPSDLYSLIDQSLCSEMEYTTGKVALCLFSSEFLLKFWFCRKDAKQNGSTDHYVVQTTAIIAYVATKRMSVSFVWLCG
jgi:hypothetical protein